MTALKVQGLSLGLIYYLQLGCRWLTLSCILHNFACNVRSKERFRKLLGGGAHRLRNMLKVSVVDRKNESYAISDACCSFPPVIYNRFGTQSEQMSQYVMFQKTDTSTGLHIASSAHTYPCVFQFRKRSDVEAEQYREGEIPPKQAHCRP